MDRRGHVGLAGRRATWFRVAAAASSAALLGMLGLAGTASAAAGSTARTAGPKTPATAATLADDSSACHLGHGVKHVVQITFDNVHFFRDNPNVPSDFQLMPNLLNFLEDNGTILSNNHTPLIAQRLQRRREVPRIANRPACCPKLAPTHIRPPDHRSLAHGLAGKSRDRAANFVGDGAELRLMRPFGRRPRASDAP